MRLLVDVKIIGKFSVISNTVDGIKLSRGNCLRCAANTKVLERKSTTSPPHRSKAKPHAEVPQVGVIMSANVEMKHSHALEWK